MASKLFRFFPRSLLAACLVGLFGTVAAAETVTVAWDPNPPAENVTGYLLYYGTVSRTDPSFVEYEHVLDVQGATEGTVDLGDAAAPSYFAVVAYNAAGLESDYSAEISTAAAGTMWSLTATVSGQGTVSPSGVVQVAEGSSQTFAFTAADGWGIDDVLVDGVSVGAAAAHTFDAVAEDHAIEVRFVELSGGTQTYDLVATTGAGGTIRPEGTVSVAAAGTQTFTITPDDGYRIGDVAIDGSSIGALSTFTFSNVTGNHSIRATFQAVSQQPQTYSVAVNAGAHGTISPSGAVSVAAGTTQTFTITADAGYQIEDVLVDGSSVGARPTVTLSDVSSDHIVVASFGLLDADGDRLPDAWEMQYFGDLTTAGTGDADGDGISDYQEYLNGTDPRVTDVVASLTPAVAAPVSGGTVDSGTPELGVYNPLNPDGLTLTYQFELAADEAMQDVVAAETGVAEGIGVTGWQVPQALTDQTRYYWRARVQTSTGASPWTPVCTFFVDRNAAPTTSEAEVAEYVSAQGDTIVEVTDPTLRAHRVMVDLPSGTLPYDFVFTLGTVENPPAASGDTRVVGKVYEFGPHGTSFENPVTILLPYSEQDLQDAAVTAPSDLGVLTYNTETLAWEPVPVDAVDYLGKRLICKVNHFSMYAVGTSPSGGTPGSDQGAGDGGQTPPPAVGGSTGGGGGGCFIRSLWP